MRLSIILGAILSVVLIYLGITSDHPMAPDFLARVQFELGYKVLVLFLMYLAIRFLSGTRRHELIKKVGTNDDNDDDTTGQGSIGHIAIYCTLMICIALVLSFVS